MPKKLNTEEFIARAREVHGDKYDYSKVEYVRSCPKVIIICKIHGEFKQTYYHHLAGQNCSKCARIIMKKKVIDKARYSSSFFINRALSIHGSKYDYSKVKYINSNTKIIIICKIHGEFTQRPNNHLIGKEGCNKCSCYLNKYTTNSFIYRATKVHGNKYNYSKVICPSSRCKVIIICKIHGEFLQLAESHLRGRGCSLCCTSQNSKGTQMITTWLNKHNIFYEREKWFHSLRGKRNRPLYFDFLIPKLNMLIEFDGEQHYLPIKAWGGYENLKETQERDQRKTQWAKDNGYTLIRICYSDEKNIHDMLDHYLKPYINKKKVKDNIVITKEYQRSLLNVNP